MVKSPQFDMISLNYAKYLYKYRYETISLFAAYVRQIAITGNELDGALFSISVSKIVLEQVWYWRNQIMYATMYYVNKTLYPRSRSSWLGVVTSATRRAWTC